MREETLTVTFSNGRVYRREGDHYVWRTNGGRARDFVSERDMVWVYDQLAAAQAEAKSVRAVAVEHAARVCELRAASLIENTKDYHAANEAQKCAVAIRWLTTQPDRFANITADEETAHG